MPLGGGAFTAQNKTLPGAYMNFVSAARADAALSERGVAALPLLLPDGDRTVRTLTAEAFYKDGLFGLSPQSPELLPLRELFLNARTARVMRVNRGGPDPAGEDDYREFLNAVEPYSFHVLALPSGGDDIKLMFAEFTRRMRETAGVKFQTVMHRYNGPGYEGIISVENMADGGGEHTPVCWVAGAQAGCRPGHSLTNAVYNGELTFNADLTQAELEACIGEGKFVFHRVGAGIRVLEDINTLIEFSPEKGSDFASNQVVRLIDQVAGDIAALFNERYIGKVPNDASGRVALWSDIVAHHRQLETLGAIEDFSPEDVTVGRGESKKSVAVTDRLTPTGAMAQLYMTIIVQ